MSKAHLEIRQQDSFDRLQHCDFEVWGLHYFFISCYCSLADYQHRRILAAITPSLLAARTSIPFWIFYHTHFNFGFLLPQKCKASSNVKGRSKELAKPMQLSSPIACFASFLVSSINAKFSWCGVTSLMVFAHSNRRSMLEEPAIRRKVISGGYGVKRGWKKAFRNAKV